MSHFCVAVFTEQGQDMDQLLEDFYVEKDVDPYVWMTKEEVIHKVRKQIHDFETNIYKEYLESPETFIHIHHPSEEFLHFLEKEFAKRLIWSDEQCYQFGVEYYEPENIDEDGAFLTTYNPKAKWDWYEVGGRWLNLLKMKHRCGIKACNSAKVREIEFPSGFETFAVLLPDGTWNECGQVLFCGLVANKDDSWSEKYKERFLDTADPEWQLTIVDCHE